MVKRSPCPQKTASGTASSRPAAGSAPNASSRWAARVRGVDRADRRDFQAVARKNSAAQIDEIAARQSRQDFEIAAHRQAVRVVQESSAAEGAIRHRVRVIGLAFQAGGNLAAHALERFVVEPRLVDGEPRQGKSLRAIAGKRLQPPGQDVAIGRKRQFDRVLIERAMEAFGVIGSGAFVDEAGEEIGGAGLAERVLRGAALEGELDGDERHRVILDEPGLNPALRDDFLDARGARAGFARLELRPGGWICRRGHLYFILSGARSARPGARKTDKVSRQSQARRRTRPGPEAKSR